VGEVAELLDAPRERHRRLRSVLRYPKKRVDDGSRSDAVEKRTRDIFHVRWHRIVMQIVGRREGPVLRRS
jgi:hypothetical protein